MFQDGTHLIHGNTREPFHELMGRGVVFKGLEERRHRYPGPAEYPRSADAIGIALDL